MSILNKIKSFLFNSNPSNSNEDKASDLKHGLSISNDIKSVLEDEILPGLDINAEKFWHDFEKIIDKFSPTNRLLLEKREDIQKQIDAWHLERRVLRIIMKNTDLF